ncbi:MAG TPA: aminopeptidase P family protein, partial [Lachnospiraceae bacterium]|nr:aminopeptidase P family protein [Lachnospiraceae bacterium]
MDVAERLSQLRIAMQEVGINWYLMITIDPHASEYISDYYKEREYFSGFTGSNGTLLIGMSECFLWTDGRYFVQAKNELEGTGIKLMKSMVFGVPDIAQYLEQHFQEGDIFGVNGALVSAEYGLKLERICEKCGVTLNDHPNIIDRIWKNRPGDSAEPATILPLSLAGQAVEDKIASIRKQMKKNETDCFVLSKLDDQMWLFNLRGNDIVCNPVAYSYTIVTMNEVCLYLKAKAVTEDVKAFALAHQIQLKEYENFYVELEQKKLGARIWIDQNNSNYRTLRILKGKGEIYDAPNPTAIGKAIKNECEIENLKEIYRLDSVELTKFLMWMEKVGIPNGISEVDAAKNLDHRRSTIPQYRDLSFPTISAFGANAAMMHYEATSKNHLNIKGNGIYLVDSGGQYDGGTTDVTRSVLCGEVNDTIKEHFTRTVMGMLRLQNAVFLKGCTGRNLDILAREPLWKILIDYKCGTGHGIGYMLNVHEDPQNISWHNRNGRLETPMEEGMLVSDEPGVYVEGSHGIRIENILLCVKKGESADGEFLAFVPLTYVPIDRKGIRPELMQPEDLLALNQYHQQVYDKISS